MESKTFVIEADNSLDKLSCHSYEPEIVSLIENLKQKGIKLSKISTKITYSSGKWDLSTSDYVPESFPNAIRLLQISNIGLDGTIINTERDKYIPEELHNKWQASKVKKGDLIIAITGTIGRIGLYDSDISANLNQALGIIRLKKEFDDLKIQRKFIHLYLNSAFAFKQFMSLGGYRAGQSGLSLDEIGSIYVILPKEEIQLKIIKKINEFEKKISFEKKLYDDCIEKLTTVLDKYTGLRIGNVPVWVQPADKIFDRIDCYFNSPQLKKMLDEINSLDSNEFDIVTSEQINFVSSMKKDEREEEKTHIFKYVDIGNTEKDLGIILDFQEDILFNLPSRAKMRAKENDIFIPRPIGSTQGVIKISKEFDRELFTTGNIQVRPRNKDEALLFWIVLKSQVVQKQFFYLQSGCSQPEITPTNFKKFVLLPFPKGKMKDQIVKESRIHYGNALKHKKKVSELRQEINSYFEKEIEALL